MNSRTAKLLRRYARYAGVPARVVKRQWNETPRPLRGKVRVTLRRVIDVMDERKAEAAGGAHEPRA